MSPDIDELLDDDEDETEPEQKPRDNAAFAKMRKDLKAAEKRASEAEAKATELESRSRHQEVAGALAALGLKQKWAKFFPADTEVTPEAIRSWAVSEEFLAAEGNEEPAPEETKGFTPTVISDGITPAARQFTRQEFEAGMRENPVKWQALAETGRVKWNNPQVTS